MRVAVGGRVFEGDAVNLSALSVPPTAVVDAVRGVGGDDVQIEVDCALPGPGHETLGVVGVGRPPSVRTSLAAAARSLGHVAPQDERIAALEREIQSIGRTTFDGADVRRRLAAVAAEEDRLRERVAAARGRLTARREAGLDIERDREAVAAEIARLSEVETDRIAAEQALSRLESELDAERARRGRRLALRDRMENLERDARAHLSAVVAEQFADAVARVPGGAVASAGPSPDDYEGDCVTALLGAIRFADLSAPVVLACRRFDSADVAAAHLGVPVILV